MQPSAEPAAPSHADLFAGVAYIDGRFMPVAEARLPILDWGFLRSDATYDVVHVWKGRFFRLDDHLDRFFRGMARLHMDPGLDREKIRAVLMECVRRSGLSDAYVEMICTRGMPPPGSRDPRQAKNRFSASPSRSSGSPILRSRRRGSTSSSAARRAYRPRRSTRR
jgi:branched-chain amino acid aminotransferase